MGKHVIYIRARDERELEAAGHDPGDWVREVIRQSLEDRAGNHSDVPKPAVPAAPPVNAPAGKEVTPDFRGKDLR